MAQTEDKHTNDKISENRHKHETNVETKHKHDKNCDHKHKHEKHKGDKNNSELKKKRKRAKWFEHEREQTSSESTVCEVCKKEELPTELFYKSYQLILVSLIWLLICFGVYLGVRCDHK